MKEVSLILWSEFYELWRRLFMNAKLLSVEGSFRTLLKSTTMNSSFSTMIGVVLCHTRTFGLVKRLQCSDQLKKIFLMTPLLV